MLSLTQVTDVKNELKDQCAPFQFGYDAGLKAGHLGQGILCHIQGSFPRGPRGCNILNLIYFFLKFMNKTAEKKDT